MAKVDTHSSAGWLRRDAERISGALPPLLAEAERLAASVAPGVHGRKQAGSGESFWQFRAAQPGDPHHTVDWRRSARSDQMFVREMEWEAAQTVSIWRDDALAAKWAKVREVRRVVTAALEVQRTDKVIGASLEAAPVDDSQKEGEA